jgi:biofilm protein TabA
MLVGHLRFPYFPLPRPIELALQYLRDTDLSQLSMGHHVIDGDKMFALVQDPMTQAWDTGHSEFHARYIDVQYLIEGEEAIAYMPANPQLPIIINQLAEKDIAFVESQTNETKIILFPEMFAIFYPGELHRPCRAVQQPCRIKKVVIKIDAGLPMNL